MLARVADFLKKATYPVIIALGGVAILMIVITVLMTVTDVVSRRLFNAPIAGTFELSSLIMAVITFLTLSYCGIKGSGHIEVNVLTTRFPKRIQDILSTIMHFLITVMMGIVSWQLVVLAMDAYRVGNVSGLLKVPIYPFGYLAALGSLMLTLVYLTKFLESLDGIITAPTKKREFNT